MPNDQDGFASNRGPSTQGPAVNELTTTSPRLSLKVGLAVFLPVGLFLFLLSRHNYLLIHSLIEFSSIALLAAVFLIGWNTRNLVRNQFFTIMATGFLAAGLVDILHTLTYKGMHVVLVPSADLPTQLWLIARALGAFAFLFAGLSLGRKDFCSDRTWLLGFLLASAALMALVWPLGLFPACLIEGQGLTPFKVYSEYVIIGLLCCAACLLWLRGRYLNQHLMMVLLFAIGMNVLSELMFTFYVDVYGFKNFLGHYFKLGGTLLIYHALVEGTVRSPFATLFRDMGQSYKELNLELHRRVEAEKQQEATHKEVSLLYRLSQAMHSTLNLDELAHLTLSAATAAEAGGFERAVLFTVNKRTGILQGMLGVTQDISSMVLPLGNNQLEWEKLPLDEQSCKAQRVAPFNQKVIKLRLPLDVDDNALARAFLEKQIVLVSRTGSEMPGNQLITGALGLGPYACAPLAGRDQVMGVLLVDNLMNSQESSSRRKRFLDLFASLAGSAMENASLVKRLGMAHDNLQDIQEQMIQGEKMAVLGEMAAQVAHELRNPLVSIGGFSQRLARQELEDPKANEYAGIIAREVRRMEEMLGNVLAFSKKQLVCFEDCNISDVLHEVFDLEYEQCQRQKIEFVTEMQKTLPKIMADYRQLYQVFLNLVINARQVMSEGGTLTVRARSGVLHGDSAVVVEVEDMGGGISPEIMRNIFNPFFSTFDKGTGLGLSISHRIVACHHGEIEVVNVEHGARFVVTLPVMPPTMEKIDSVRDVQGD